MINRLSIKQKLLFLVFGVSVLVYAICFTYVILSLNKIAIREATRLVNTNSQIQAQSVFTNIRQDLKFTTGMSSVVETLLYKEREKSFEERSEYVMDGMRNAMDRDFARILSIWVSHLKPSDDASSGYVMEEYEVRKIEAGKPKVYTKSSNPITSAELDTFYDTYKMSQRKHRKWTSGPYQKDENVDTVWYLKTYGAIYQGGEMLGDDGTEVVWNVYPDTRAFLDKLTYLDGFENSKGLFSYYDGTILSHHEKEKMMSNIRDEKLLKQLDLDKILENITQGKDTSIWVTDFESGIENYVSFNHSPVGKDFPEWLVVYWLPKSEMLAAYSGIKFSVIAIGIVGFLILALIVFRITKNIVESISNSKQVLQKLAEGDYELDHLEVKYKDELSQMALSINALLKDLEEKSLFAREIGMGNMKVGYQLSSEKDILGKSLLSMKQNLTSYINETRVVINMAGEEGDLSTRVDTGNKIGVWLELSEELNKLLDVVAGPFRELNQLANAMASGDLSRRLSFGTKGEISQLVNNLNKALESLNQLMVDIIVQAGGVNASSNDMRVVSEEMTQTSGEIASAIAEISEGAQKQLSKVDESSGLIEMIQGSAKNMLDQTESINAAANRGVQFSKNGLELVNNFISSMTEIAASSEKNNDSFFRLTERSNKMVGALSSIMEIASQTNLLALNAAIEAAQAGEAGRGFAVVAEEIRKLAEDSKRSANEINQLLEEIQTDTKESSKVLEIMNKSIEVGAEASSKVSNAFDEIASASEETRNLSENVVHSAKNQIDGIKKVVEITESVVVIAEETATGAEEVATSAAELSSGMENLDSRSEKLEEIANKLEEGVNQFRLNEAQELVHG